MSKQSEKKYDVIIIGGGPVGLFLAALLHQQNISCIVLEKRSEVRTGSRSLGIHPPSLELFDEAGLAENFIRSGIRIKHGIAFLNNVKIGEISFEDCPKPYNFILSLPQHQTEKILDAHINQASGDLLLRQAEVHAVKQNNDEVCVTYEKHGENHQITGAFLVGCDGKNSLTRQQMGSSFAGKSYPDTYIMGDFTDNTPFGSDAAIYLCEEGLIESFPLTGNKRRWVVKTRTYISEVLRSDLETRISLRIGKELQSTENYMLSSFGVQKYLADPLVRNRIILAGDAAHVVSPIGGQGLNLGWLGAYDLANTFHRIFHKGKNHTELTGYEQRRIKAAGNAMRRAEFNMRLGRKSNYPAIKKGILKVIINTPLSRLMARIFSMRGIESWII